MAYQNRKLERANQLFSEIKDKEKELEALFGDVQESRRGRPRKDRAGDSGSVGGAAASVGDATDH